MKIKISRIRARLIYNELIYYRRWLQLESDISDINILNNIKILEVFSWVITKLRVSMKE